MLYKCEKCGFGCMSEKLLLSHIDRCEKGLSQLEEKRAINKKRREQFLLEKEKSLYGK